MAKGMAEKIYRWPFYMFYDIWPFYLLRKKTLLHAISERRHSCVLAEEDPVAHQHGKKALLHTSKEGRPCWACLLSCHVKRHRMCSIGGSGNMLLKYLYSNHFFTGTLLKPHGKFSPNFLSILLLKRDWEFVQMLMLHWLSCTYMVKKIIIKNTFFFFKAKNCSDDDPFISCNGRIGKMLHNICISALAISLRWVSHGP